MARFAVDTTFLIDLQNERRGRGADRGALAFLRERPGDTFLLPAVALGEYLEGFDDPESLDARALVATLELLPVTVQVATIYARLTRELRAARQLIGANDLWIASTARAAELPIVTRDQHFSRVTDLQVVHY